MQTTKVKGGREALGQPMNYLGQPKIILILSVCERERVREREI